mmetsp:Transcript_4350/g.7996  ORF Transcript_4350/g.7996 Transcript_4350/m.7996 type:complete len:225 (+) Transcript_4350:224-898(+)
MSAYVPRHSRTKLFGPFSLGLVNEPFLYKKEQRYGTKTTDNNPSNCTRTFSACCMLHYRCNRKSFYLQFAMWSLPAIGAGTAKVVCAYIDHFFALSSIDTKRSPMSVSICIPMTPDSRFVLTELSSIRSSHDTIRGITLASPIHFSFPRRILFAATPVKTCVVGSSADDKLDFTLQTCVPHWAGAVHSVFMLRFLPGKFIFFLHSCEGSEFPVAVSTCPTVETM